MINDFSIEMHLNKTESDCQWSEINECNFDWQNKTIICIIVFFTSDVVIEKLKLVYSQEVAKELINYVLLSLWWWSYNKYPTRI